MSKRSNSYGSSPPIIPPSASGSTPASSSTPVFSSRLRSFDEPTKPTSRRQKNKQKLRHRSHNHKRSVSYDELQKRYQKLLLLEKEAKIRDRIIEENNGWNSELEYIAASVGEKCIGLKWMHSQCSTFYNYCYHFLGITVIIITAGAGTGTVTQISNCSFDPVTQAAASNWVLILVGVLIYISTVVLSIQQFKNWGSVSKEHQQTHSDYSSLEHDIRIHLGKCIYTFVHFESNTNNIN
jgi:hypothetical protein